MTNKFVLLAKLIYKKIGTLYAKFRPKPPEVITYSQPEIILPGGVSVTSWNSYNIKNSMSVSTPLSTSVVYTATSLAIGKYYTINSATIRNWQ